MEYGEMSGDEFMGSLQEFLQNNNVTDLQMDVEPGLEKFGGLNANMEDLTADRSTKIRCPESAGFAMAGIFALSACVQEPAKTVHTIHSDTYLV